jgi:hypothetical protein
MKITLTKQRAYHRGTETQRFIFRSDMEVTEKKRKRVHHKDTKNIKKKNN